MEVQLVSLTSWYEFARMVHFRNVIFKNNCSSLRSILSGGVVVIIAHQKS